MAPQEKAKSLLLFPGVLCSASHSHARAHIDKGSATTFKLSKLNLLENQSACVCTVPSEVLLHHAHNSC